MPLTTGLMRAASRKTTYSNPSQEMSVTYLLSSAIALSTLDVGAAQTLRSWEPEERAGGKSKRVNDTRRSFCRQNFRVCRDGRTGGRAGKRAGAGCSGGCRYGLSTVNQSDGRAAGMRSSMGRPRTNATVRLG